MTVRMLESTSAEKLPSPVPANASKSKNTVVDHPKAPFLAIKKTHYEEPLLAISVPPESYYFQHGELTEKPSILQNDPSDMLLNLPDVPAQSVVLHLLINERGDIDLVEVKENFLPAYAVELVSNSFLKIKFYPGEVDGRAVKSQLKIIVSLDNEPPSP